MKRAGWIVLIVLLLVVAGLFFWWQSPSSKSAKQQMITRVAPQITVASVNISDIDDNGIKLNSKVQVVNPMPVALHTKGLQYELYIDSIMVLKDSYNKAISVNASDSTVIQLPMELLAKPMARVLQYFDENKIDSADYTMKATVLVDVPVAGNHTVAMNVSKRLPALRLPKVKVTDVDLNALQLKKKGIDIVVQVRNPNAFPLKLKDGTFSFAVEDDMRMKGALEKVVNIPAHGTENVAMHAEVDDGSMLKTGWKLLTDKDDTHFTYNFRCKLLSESGLLQNSTMATSMQGTLGALVKAVK